MPPDDALDDLRQYLLDQSPALQAQATELTKLLRDSVELDRLNFTQSGARPTRNELDAWALSSARLYNNPTFEQWLANYRATRAPVGKLRLWPNKGKKAKEPDFVGDGKVAGRHYAAAAWLDTHGNLRLSLIQTPAHG